MIKNILASYVVPLVLAGTSYIMPKDVNFQVYIGYACYVAAFLIFGFGLFKNYGKRFFPHLFNYWPFKRVTGCTPLGVAMKDLSPWIYFNNLTERWKLSKIELHEKILNTELRGKRHVDYTDYTSSQETPYMIPVNNIEAEFDIIDDKLCFKRKDIEEFEKKHGKATST